MSPRFAVTVDVPALLHFSVEASDEQAAIALVRAGLAHEARSASIDLSDSNVISIEEEPAA